LGALLSAGTLLLTQSRSALTGTTLALAILLWLVVPKVRLVLAALLVIGIAAAIYVGPQSLTDSLADQYGPGFNTAKNLRTAEGRAELWGRALLGIEDFSFTGMGMNTFRRVMPDLYPMPAIPPPRISPTRIITYCKPLSTWGCLGL
jgi:O-antigen ligase